MNYNEEKFLDVLYKELYKSDEVLHTKEKSDTKEQSIKRYMDRLETIHNKANTDSKKNLVKRLYFDKYVIKKDNLSHFLSDADKLGIINAQKKSLSTWIDYLTDENAKYPMWAKYWVFQQILKMGTYDELNDKYTRRTKKTVKPFIEANPEMIAKCIGNLIRLLGNEKLSTQEIRKLASDISFEKMYIEYQKNRKEQYKSDEGIWIKYNDGDEAGAKRLAASLEGYNTGWCTANEETAINQLCGKGGYIGGDFYVYYTKDEEGEYKNPRIAIRFNGQANIAEIRGVEEHQNLEEEMIPVLESKLKEMTFLLEEDIYKYINKINDLKLLLIIKEKTIKNIPLTEEEIKKLYFNKFGFGWENDPLVNRIKEKRNFVDDYNILSNEDIKVKVSFIATNLDILEKANSVFLYDKEVIKKISKVYDNILKYVDKDILDDRDFILELVKDNGLVLCNLDEKYKKDYEIVLSAVNNNGLALASADDKFKKDKELITIALLTHRSVFQFVDEEIKKDKEFIKHLINNFPTVIQYASDEIKADREIVLYCIRAFKNSERGSYNFYYIISDKLRDDKEIALEIIEQHPLAILNVSERLKEDKDIVKLFIQKAPIDSNTYLLTYIPRKFLSDIEIALELVKKSGSLFYKLKEKFRDNKEIALEAVKSDGSVYYLISERLRKDKDIIIAAARRNYRILFDIQNIGKVLDISDLKILFLNIVGTIKFTVTNYVQVLDNEDKVYALDCDKKRLKKIFSFDENYANKIEQIFDELIETYMTKKEQNINK